MDSIIWLVDTLIRIYIWLLIASVVLSWLVAFNVVNTRHPFVNTVGRFLYQVTEPALRPIRRVVPSFGGIDVSPVILALIIEFARRFLIYDILL
jgi:YggT family protein